jgi:hypothetical protein
MRTLARTILMRGVRGSWFDAVPSCLKQFHNITTISQLATFVEANILVRKILGEAM